MPDGAPALSAAIAAYQQAAQDSAAVWNKMGMAYQMMYNSQEAVRCYQASLKLNPDNPHVLNNLEPSTTRRSFMASGADVSPGDTSGAGLGADLQESRERPAWRSQLQKGWEAYQTALSLTPKSSWTISAQGRKSWLGAGSRRYELLHGPGMCSCRPERLRH